MPVHTTFYVGIVFLVLFFFLFVGFIVAIVALNLYVRRNQRTYAVSASNHYGGKTNSKDNVLHFYNVATDFYLWGWGPCFHFQNRLPHEQSMDAAIDRGLEKLVWATQLQPGKKAIDLGCGVAGPLCKIATLSNADVTGVTLNPYQVELGNERIKQNGLQVRCRVVQADFLKLPFPDNKFDVAYDLEASPHATDPLAFYREAFRVLRPGGRLWTKQWVLTDKYDSGNPDHQRWVEAIRLGNSLPTPIYATDVNHNVRKAGFTVLVQSSTATELAGTPNNKMLPWWTSLEENSSTRLTCRPLMRACTNAILDTLEANTMYS